MRRSAPAACLDSQHFGFMKVTAPTAESSSDANPLRPTQDSPPCRYLVASIGILLFFLLVALPYGYARDHKKDRKEDYGHGFDTEIEAPESEVLQALQSVLNDGMIEGSKEYLKDKYVEKADPAQSSPLFPAWNGPGKIFYKVREKVLAPANFWESNDEGTLAVRYVVRSRDATRTILHIDAVFYEEFRRIVHPSNGSVESAEYRAIQDRVDAIELDKKQTREAEKHRQEELAQRSLEHKKELEEEAALSAAEGSSNSMEAQVANLRHQVERIVKVPGADLKSAPFRTATTLKPLQAGADVVILIVTPYWYGVETEDGQHGWINHSELEPLP
jgi:hypothetical protein